MYSFNKPSIVEDTALDILKDNPNGLFSNELVKIIQLRQPNKLTGNNPLKSFYSIIYRREKKREILNMPTLFIISRHGKFLLYKLNNEVEK